MESNEETELTSKTETDSERRLTALRGAGLAGGGMEQKARRTRGHGQQCSDWGWGGSMRGQNGNGKNTIKINLKRKRGFLKGNLRIT